MNSFKVSVFYFRILFFSRWSQMHIPLISCITRPAEIISKDRKEKKTKVERTVRMMAPRTEPRLERHTQGPSIEQHIQGCSNCMKHRQGDYRPHLSSMDDSLNDYASEIDTTSL